MKKYLVWLDEVGIEDIPLVGGKNASLGEMVRNLSSLGVNVPYGFVVTSESYYEFIRYNNLEEEIKSILKPFFVVCYNIIVSENIQVIPWIFNFYRPRRK